MDYYFDDIIEKVFLFCRMRWDNKKKKIDKFE